LIHTSIEKKLDLVELEIDELILRPLSMMYVEKTNIESRFYDAGCIHIKLGKLNIMEFSLDEDTKNTIVQQGKDAVHHYYKNQRRPERRHSL